MLDQSCFSAAIFFSWTMGFCFPKGGPCYHARFDPGRTGGAQWRAMRFALHLQSHAAPDGAHAAPDGAGESLFPALAAQARWAEQAGFDALSVLDHLEPFAPVGPRTTPLLEGWTALAGLAGVTSRVGLLTLVSNVSLRPASVLARAGAALDHVSGGRMALGVGSGGYRPEYRAHGLPYPSFAERTGLLEETLIAVRALWERARTTLRGRFVHLDEAVCEPKPLHRPWVVVGGRSEPTLAVAARHADAVNALGAGPADAAALALRIGALAADAGRPAGAVELTLLERVILGPTPAEAQRAWEAAGSPARGGHRGLVGTPEQVAEQVRAYARAGVGMLFVHFPPGDERSRTLFAARVLPALRDQPMA
jgi:alkanesulfonate monooxygenase SsuD/methylene tetrahydromethanopterin reductase-like flavin-dependent oxidoreductase (luciferase family)